MHLSSCGVYILVKIAFLVPDVTPYRAYVFEELHARGNHDILVISMDKHTSNDEASPPFPLLRLPARQLRFTSLRAGPTSLAFNSRIGRELKAGDLDRKSVV